MKAVKSKVLIVHTKIIRTHIEYTCPKCKVQFIEAGFNHSKVSRILCDCGQEIIANYVVQYPHLAM